MTAPSAAPTGTPDAGSWTLSRLRSPTTSVAVAIALIMILGSFAGISLGANSSLSTPGTHTSALPQTAARPIAAPTTPPSYGAGTFWENAPLPNVSANNTNCVGEDNEFIIFGGPSTPCGQVNVTNEPSLNLTTNGVLATAYTAYTNSTPCEAQYPLLANYTHTQIGITTSRDGGASWSSPVYLGNTNCTTGGNVEVGTGPESAAFDSSTEDWFIANYASDNVTVVSDTTGAVVATIPVGTNPVALADDTEFGYLFVANAGSSNVTVIDVYCDCVVQTLAVGTDPVALVYDEDANCAGPNYTGECFGGEVFVANSGSDNVTALSYNYSVGEFTQSANITVANGPDGIDFDPDYGDVFVADGVSGEVTVISDYNNSAYVNLSVGSDPGPLAVAGNSGTVVVVNSGSDNVSVISESTNAVTANVGVGSDPVGIAYAPPMDEMFIVNNGSNNVSVISLATDSVVANVAVGTGPDAALFDPSADAVLVTNYGSDDVSEILTTTNTVIDTIAVGSGPAGIWFDSSFEYLVANSGSNNVTWSSDADGQEYLNNWQPTLTSLANGTLVVAWVEFNGTSEPGCFFFCFGAQFPDFYEEENDFGASRLVVAFSYDNGTTWTDPTAIDTSTIYGGGCSFCESYVYEIQQRPSITAFGQTIYLAWTDITEGWSEYDAYEYNEECTLYGYGCPYGDANVELTVSATGTDNFAPATDLPVLQAPGPLNASVSVAANPTLTVLPNGTVVAAYMSNLSFNGSLGTFDPCYDYVTMYYSEDECGSYQSDLVVAQSPNNGTSWSTGVAASDVEDSRDYQSGSMLQDSVGPGDTSLPAPKVTYDPNSSQVVVAFTADVSYIECLQFYDDCESEYSSVLSTPEVFVANGSLVTNNWTSRLVSSWTGLSNDGPGGEWGSYFYNPSIVSTSNGTIYITAQYVNASACTSVPGNTWLFYEAGESCGEGLEVYGTSTDNGTTFTPPADVDNIGTWYGEMPPGTQASMVAAGNQVWVAWTQTTCPDWLANTSVGEPRCEWGGYYYSYTPVFHLLNGFTSNTTVIVSRLYLGTGLNITFTETGLPAGTPWSVDFSGIVRSGLAPTTLSVSGVPPSANQSWSSPIVPVAPGERYVGIPSTPSPGSFTTATTITWTFVLQYTVTIATVPSYPAAGGGSSGGGEVYLDNYEFASGGSGDECSEGYYFNAGGSSDDCYETEYTSINYNITPDPGTNWVDAGTSITLQAIPLNFSQFWSEYNCGGDCFSWVNLSFEAWTGTGTGSYNGTSNQTTIVVNGPINETASFGINAYCYWDNFPSFLSTCAQSGLTYTFHESGLPSGTQWGVSVWGEGLNQSTPYPAFTTNGTLPVTDPALTGTAYFQAYTVPSGIAGEVWAPTADPSSPILGPLETGSLIHYALTSVDSAAFSSSVSEVGLPNGTSWGFSLDGIASGVPGTAVDNVTFPGGTHDLSANPVYLDNGTGYVASAIDVQPYVMNESWTNVTSASIDYAFDGAASILVVYTPIYELTATASTGGSVTNAGTTWLTPTQNVSLIASADPGYTFIGWTGTGPGSRTTTGTSPPTAIYVTATGGPVSELATFAQNATPRYVVTVIANGLTAGGTYALVFNGTTYYGNGTFALPGYLGGDYSISVPYAYDNANSLIRFLPTGFTTSGLTAGPDGTYGLNGNGATVTVSFTTQYALTVSASGSGTTSPAPGIYWESLSNATVLTATPSAGNVFVDWTGTGSDSENSTTSSFTLTTTGPAAEAAQFAVYHPPPPQTYTLTVTETGLPSGTAWSLSDGITGYSSTTSSIVISGLNGTYTVNVPTVRIGTGAQYASSMSDVSEAVTSNLPVSVTFSGQFELTVISGAGGSATPGTEWVAAGATVAIAATASTGYSFVGWLGSGPESYNGTTSSATVTVSGPISETAQFATVPTKAVSLTAPNTLPSYLPWLALGLLLAIGLVVGYAVSRRGGGSTPPSAPPTTWSAEGAPAGAMATTPPPADDSASSASSAAAEYDESK